MTEKKVRLVVIGDGATGKSALVQAYSRTLFSAGETIPKKLVASTMVDEHFVSLSVVDDDPLLSHSTAATDVFLVCFSVVQPQSFDNVRAKWIPDITHYNPDLRSNTEIVQRLSSKNHRPIDHTQGIELAAELRASDYKECSATSSEGIKDLFEDAIRLVVIGNKQRRRNNNANNLPNNNKKKNCDLL